MTKSKRKGGLVSDFSPWVGRWGVYWRIQKWEEFSELAERYAEKYPKTWEIRMIRNRYKIIRNM